MKKNLIVFLLTLSSIAYSQSDKFTTADEIDLLLKNEFFQTCQVAVDAYDLSAKEIIYSRNKKQLMRPASNMKVLTTSTALYFLGEDYKFNTIIAHDGEIEDSILIGNLYFIGGFDPDFTFEDLDTMIIELKEKGISKIEGNIYGDVSKMDSLYWGNGWMWDDNPDTDSPYMTPLVINNVAVKIIVTPTVHGDKPKVSFIPELYYPKFLNEAETGESDSIDLKVTRDWLNNSDDIIISGTIGILNDPDTTEINISNTTNYFLALAKQTLEKNGITLCGKCDISSSPDNVENLVEHERPFSEVIINLNKVSDNLSAEMTLRAMAYEYFGKSASAKKGVTLIDSLITIVGLDPKEYRLVDGSGVSHYNLVSVELLNEILKYFYLEEKELFHLLYNSFPIGGVDGTLENRMKETPTFENVHAKTGTLSGVSSLSGYLTSKIGHMISFAINTQNFVGSARLARNYQDKICEILANIEN